MTAHIPCYKCGTPILEGAWCNDCVEAGRMDIPLIYDALTETWMRGHGDHNMRDTQIMAETIYQKLRLFGRLNGELQRCAGNEHTTPHQGCYLR